MEKLKDFFSREIDKMKRGHTDTNHLLTEFSNWELVCINPEVYDIDSANDEEEDDRIFEFQLKDQSGNVIWHESGASWDMEDQLLPFDNMEFHQSFDRLMTIVEQIEAMSMPGRSVKDIFELNGLQDEEDVIWTFSVEIIKNQCIIHRHISITGTYYRTEKDFIELYDPENNSKKDATYMSLVKFVMWYNNYSNN